MYTWKKIGFSVFLILLFAFTSHSKAPFVEINTVHQAYSQFEVNLILNENRNHPIFMTTVSIDQSKKAAESILLQALQSQAYGGFAILIDCREYSFNLNKTLGVCQRYDKTAPVDETNDPNFSCQLMTPAETKIKDKGHVLMKNHGEQNLQSGQYFKPAYLKDMIKKNIPDFVQYVEDDYDLSQFFQNSSEFKSSKQPKLLYFDENLLAPLFLRKIASMLNGIISVGVTDQVQIAKRYDTSFDSLLLFEYDFNEKDYTVREMALDQISPVKKFLEDEGIKQYMGVKKFRDILLDFQHSNFTINNYSQIKSIWNLQTQGRIIILQVSTNQNYQCDKLLKLALQYETLFNYVCFSQKNKDKLKFDSQSFSENFLMINDNLENGKWISKKDKAIYSFLPKSISRQRVSTSTQADHCLRTAQVTKRDPILYYFNEKSRARELAVMNYLNSLPEVTSLLYFCQIYLPDSEIIKKFQLKQNTLFTLADPTSTGHMKKVEHTKIDNFIQIKMFLREISIQKMIQVYDNRLLSNSLKQIKSSEDLTEECFNKKCIIGLIATGRYRQDTQLNILRELKLQYEEQYNFVWIDGICHWDVPKQLKFLKKKQKVIQKSYVMFYNEKQISYSLWDSTKTWDSKALNRWIKSLRNSKNISHLKFGIDIQDRECKNKKKVKKQVNEEL